ncbi:MAG: PTS glucose transporter subunit IIA [Solobacterium sp.]|jgi:PTS system glucose-specific IIA component|uniref:PTS sugar transporter subunit IIA n=1 Tax=Holdemanella sp. TaxID=1971762 RepID=UPI003AF1AAF9|nr:PTS glucose transporter subunit IIA [Solobacterium sp.]MBD9216967.1 PTS glucose transporter subunit IIA [Solobacterium sp.]
MISPKEINDPMFAEEMMGQTIGFILSDGEVVAPATGRLEVLFPTGHAFALRMNDGTRLLIHIGIDTVNLKGKGFKVLKKQGDRVKAGEVVVKVDLDTVKQAGYDTTTMLIVTEPIYDGEKINFIGFGDVKKSQIIIN